LTFPDALPVGGSTGCDHEHSAVVEQAAHWLAEHRASLVRPIIPELRDRFGLTIKEAIEAAVLGAKYEYLGRDR